MTDFIDNRELRYSTLTSGYEGPHAVTEVAGNTDEQKRQANLVTSLVPNGFGYYPQKDSHKPVLDLDFPCTLVPSSTDGKFHLYMNVDVKWESYVKVLDAMAEAGILEAGYVNASKARGYTAVRAPWVKKHVGEETIAVSNPVSELPFRTILRLTEDDFGNRDLHLTSDDEDYSWSRSIAHTEFITEPEKFPLDNNEVWVRVGHEETDFLNKTTEDRLDGTVLGELVKEGFLVDRNTFIKVSSPHYTGFIYYQKFYMVDRNEDSRSKEVNEAEEEGDDFDDLFGF